MDDMMQYTVLAEHYDRLTFDVDYQGYAAFADRLFRKHKIPGRLILEQACGTGSISLELSRMGYEMISSDISPDMLSVAQEKCGELECPPVFLCQDMCELDLYGTVEGALCSLDGMNYIHPEDISEIFHLLSLILMGLKLNISAIPLLILKDLFLLHKIKICTIQQVLIFMI